jgi:phospholipid/cholesterol/gamma-HCH transport system ATP-binding protein
VSADERDRQATPPSGSKVPDDATAEPSDQPRDDDVPTPWELKEKEKAESGGDGEATTTWVRGEDGNPEEVAADDERAAAVTYEPPEGGQDDDEYQWHTAKRTRSESAETDAVEFIDVKKAFGRNTVLNGLNLGIPEGQISMILGPSGTGKSVCIKHMVGLLYPDEGDVLVHGESVPNMRDDDLFEMRKKFGVLFQDGALFGSMNLLDNVAFPLRQHTDKGEDEIMEIVTRRLKEVGLGGAGDKMPNELSGGMRKRAGFARALVLDPQIVLFDEPDSGLDPVRTALLCELIKEIHEENGGAYVVITHDIMSARRVAEYIAILWKGRIVESGPASELFNSDNQFVRQFLSGEARGPLGME